MLKKSKTYLDKIVAFIIIIQSSKKGLNLHFYCLTFGHKIKKIE